MKCSVCNNIFVFCDNHHIIPQSKGGKNLKQIPLCPSCHSTLHILAKNPHKKEEFLALVKNKQVAEILLSILDKTKSIDTVESKITITIPKDLHRKIKETSKLLSISMENLIITILKSYNFNL